MRQLIRNIATGSQDLLKVHLMDFVDLEEILNFDHCCQLFAHLLKYDVLLLVRIHYYGSPDEPVPAQDLINFLGPGVDFQTRTIVTQTIDTLNRGARYGEILDAICQEFGTGSLLLLCDHIDLDL